MSPASASKRRGENGLRIVCLVTLQVRIFIYTFLSEVLSMPTDCESKQQRFWRDCADAQASMKLCCLYMSEDPFSHDVAYVITPIFYTERLVSVTLRWLVQQRHMSVLSYSVTNVTSKQRKSLYTYTTTSCMMSTAKMNYNNYPPIILSTEKITDYRWVYWPLANIICKNKAWN